MTAEALKTISKPMKTSSTLCRRATCRRLRALPYAGSLACQYRLLEDSSPLFVIFKLIETGAGGRQEDNISGYRLASRLVDRGLQRTGMNDLVTRRKSAFRSFLPPNRWCKPL